MNPVNILRIVLITAIFRAGFGVGGDNVNITNSMAVVYSMTGLIAVIMLIMLDVLDRWIDGESLCWKSKGAS